MLRRVILVLLLCTSCCIAQTDIPKTPAGKVLAIWLEAFNSGDHLKLESFAKAYDSKEPHNFVTDAGFQSQTGGFNLLGIESSEAQSITFRVKERGGQTIALGTIEVTTGEPAVIEHFVMNAVPPGSTIENIKLDGMQRQHVIEGTIAQLKDAYIDVPTAQKMAEALQAHEKKGDYDSITSGAIFASRLTADLQDVSHDKHLHVNYAPYKLPPEHEDNGPSPEDEARMRKDMEHMNCGFDKVEILPGNIGYIKFNVFAPPHVCGATVAAAMGFVAHADALIFDLRENHGGDPKMVDTIASYLFDKPTHLNDLYDRKQNETTQYWTLPYLPGERLAKQPVYVLTSSQTFSGGEEFCYDLKTQKRATLVGETTGGGAHPVSGHRIDDHFMIGVPFAKAVNPITKTDWEGTGVSPDVAVKADDALDTAKKLAGEKLHAAKTAEPPKTTTASK